MSYYSVVLTELGIVVLCEGAVEKAFQFSSPVESYLTIKNKKLPREIGRDLLDHLDSVGVMASVNDEYLLSIFRRESIDSQQMSSSEIEQIQASKSRLVIEAGFAVDANDAMTKLREFAMGLSSSKVTSISSSPDQHVIQAVNSLDEIDKIANALGIRLREWYGLHFPELDNVVDSVVGYAHIVLIGRRESLDTETIMNVGFPEDKTQMLMLIISRSRGGEISDANLAIVQQMAKQLIDLYDIRRGLEEHTGVLIDEIAPNLSAILGTVLTARMLARVGSIKRLACLPASTIQVLGAERALFRSLRTGSRPPKHGLLFQHPMVHSAPRWQRGKIARAIAAKAVVAARVDVYGEGLNHTLLEKLNIRVEEIGKKYENPVERKYDDARDDSNNRYSKHTREQSSRSHKKAGGGGGRRQDKGRRKFRQGNDYDSGNNNTAAAGAGGNKRKSRQNGNSYDGKNNSRYGKNNSNKQDKRKRFDGKRGRKRS